MVREAFSICLGKHRIVRMTLVPFNALSTSNYLGDCQNTVSSQLNGESPEKVPDKQKSRRSCRQVTEKSLRSCREVAEKSLRSHGQVAEKSQMRFS